MKISKNEYIKRVEAVMPDLSEDAARDLFFLGSEQDYTKDNDIFEAIHAHIGSLEVPVSGEEHEEAAKAIRGLIADYHNLYRS